MSEVTRPAKIEGIQYMRAVAAVSVIAIHTLNSAVIYFGNRYSIQANVAMECVENCMWWGVPCFLMITGCLMLSPDKVIDYKNIYGWYIPRMISVLILFGIPFSWIELIFDAQAISYTQIPTAVYNVLSGNTWAHLWYIYALIGIYILLPVWRLITKAANLKDLKYIVCIYIFFFMVCPVLGVFNLDFSKILKIGIATIYPCWMFLGYMFSRKMLVVKRNIACWVLFMTCFLEIVITAVCTTKRIETKLLFSYNSLLILAQSCAIFSLLFSLKLRDKNPLKKILLSIGDKSFGIYIIHMFFVNLFYKAFGIDPFSSVFMCPFLILLNLVLSWGCAFVMKKCPILKRIV